MSNAKDLDLDAIKAKFAIINGLRGEVACALASSRVALERVKLLQDRLDVLLADVRKDINFVGARVATAIANFDEGKDVQ